MSFRHHLWLFQRVKQTAKDPHNTTTIRASVDYRLTIHVLVCIVGVNFSARESTTRVLEIKRGRSLQMEKQVTAQQHALIRHTFPDYSKRPPLIWLFPLKSSRFAYSLAMSSVCGAFLMNGAPRLLRLRKNTRQVRSAPVSLMLSGAAAVRSRSSSEE